MKKLLTEKKNIWVLAAFGILTLIGALNHELWFDEIQAWQIVRFNDISGIINQLKYEGHPPLWYFVLYILQKLGLSVEMLPIVSWALSLCTAAVIMEKAPFKFLTKLAIVFSSGLFYFNSVMARPYALIGLLIFIIAWIYPKREKHPIFFGILVALLANTHVMMCGLVGALGIFMIIDLFKGFKVRGAKGNILSLTGLLISGVGVITLVLPLLSSLSANSSVEEKLTFDLFEIVVRLISVFYEAQRNSMAGPNEYISFIAAAFGAVALVVFHLLFRKAGRSFVMLGLFTVLYTLINTLVYPVCIANRGAVFLLCMAFSLWIAVDEGAEIPRVPLVLGKLKKGVNQKIFLKTIEMFEKLFENPRKSAEKIIALLMISTVPGGVAYYVSDIIKPFNPYEEAAQWIEENLPEDTVLVVADFGAECVGAYLPESYRFYSTVYSDFYRYYIHCEEPETTDMEKMKKDLENAESIVYLSCSPVSKDCIIFEGNIEYGVNTDMVCVAP